MAEISEAEALAILSADPTRAAALLAKAIAGGLEESSPGNYLEAAIQSWKAVFVNAARRRRYGPMNRN
jgi:hypothetical protein